jgi:shikimate dehydrogenase
MEAEIMESKCYRSELVGLLGCPVDENPTVVTIEAGFKALGLNYRYNTMEVKPENLEIAIKALKALGFKGTHITIPHKVAVLKYLDHVAEDAKIMGAVNTVYIKNGETYGENTDGKGFLMSLREGGIELTGKKVVVLGAGGAARAITVELANAGVASITVVNIEKEAGETLVKLLNEKTKTSAKFIFWDKTYSIPADADILVQATSVGLYPDTNCPNIDYDTLRPELVVCDVVPNPPVTEFIKRARAKGCKTFIGLEMLVNQAGISFKYWTGKDAPIEAMKKALTNEFLQYV